jgi:hypothetical protein
MTCEHERFKYSVSVSNPRDNKEDADAGYQATITIRCGICGLPFEFVGVSPEPSNFRPMVAHEDRELRVPIKPKGERLKREKVQ